MGHIPALTLCCAHIASPLATSHIDLQPFSPRELGQGSIKAVCKLVSTAVMHVHSALNVCPLPGKGSYTNLIHVAPVLCSSFIDGTQYDFRIVNGSASCCPPGTASGKWRDAVCQAAGNYPIPNIDYCLPGYSYDGKQCHACALGTFTSDTSEIISASCTQCPYYAYTPTIGSSTCTPCPNKQYRSSTHGNKCLPCPWGSSLEVVNNVLKCCGPLGYRCTDAPDAPKIAQTNALKAAPCPPSPPASTLCPPGTWKGFDTDYNKYVCNRCATGTGFMPGHA